MGLIKPFFKFVSSLLVYLYLLKDIVARRAEVQKRPGGEEDQTRRLRRVETAQDVAAARGSSCNSELQPISYHDIV